MIDVLFTGWWKRWWPRPLEQSSCQRCEHCLQAIRVATWTTLGKVSLYQRVFLDTSLWHFSFSLRCFPSLLETYILGRPSAVMSVYTTTVLRCCSYCTITSTLDILYFSNEGGTLLSQGVWQCNSQSRSSNCFTTDQLGAWNQSRHRSSFQVLQ